MDTPTGSVKKIALNYGLILGLLSIVLSVIQYVMNVHMDRPWWGTVLSIVLTILIIVYGLKAFKKDNGGFLSLGEALKTGLGIAVISGVVGIIYLFIFANFIEPDFTTQILENAQEQMIERNPDMTQEQMDMGLSMTEKFTTFPVMAAFTLIGSLFFGFIISLIAGLIMKQNRPEHL